MTITMSNFFCLGWNVSRVLDIPKNKTQKVVIFYSLIYFTISNFKMFYETYWSSWTENCSWKLKIAESVEQIGIQL